MMEVWIAGVIQACISGAIVLFLTKTVEKSNETTQRANEAEKRIIQNDLNSMGEKFSSMEHKQQELTNAFYALKEKVVLVAQKQDDAQGRMHELIKAVEGIKINENHGRVIRKN